MLLVHMTVLENNICHKLSRKYTCCFSHKKACLIVILYERDLNRKLFHIGKQLVGAKSLKISQYVVTVSNKCQNNSWQMEIDTKLG